MATYIPLLQTLITSTGVITAAVVAAILARRSYVKQKEIDRHEDLMKRRAEEYESYIKAFHKVVHHLKVLRRQGGHNDDTEHYLGESLAEYDRVYNFLTVIATDCVLERATTLNDRLAKIYDSESIDPDKIRADAEIRNPYTELIFAMREDCFEATKLSMEDVNPLLDW
jgi:hypothetical protein